MLQVKDELSKGLAVRQRVSIPIFDGSLSGDFFSFDGLTDGLEHIAIGLGNWEASKNPLVRLHSECLTGDVFGSQKCDCGHQLRESLVKIADVGGFLLYLRQEGRGIGLYNKLDAYALQEQGLNTFEANRHLNFPDDLRDYRCAAEMLSVLSAGPIRLLTNNPDKAEQLQKYGIGVSETVGTGVFVNANNYKYLQAKTIFSRHIIKLGEK
jgi:GTP cyclohydrolase II